MVRYYVNSYGFVERRAKAIGLRILRTPNWKVTCLVCTCCLQFPYVAPSVHVLDFFLLVSLSLIGGRKRWVLMLFCSRREGEDNHTKQLKYLHHEHFCGDSR